MEKILENENCKAIGVSNYMTHHMEELLANCQIPPSVNQIELSPYCFQSRADIVTLCRKNNIAVEAYSPLVRTKRFDDPKLLSLTKKYGKTPAQILIRWALQENIIVIPKSSNPLRIKENANVFDFEISNEDMALINNFDENLIVCWDPMKTP
jgi:diketogulonate reductase-like aldo/keto reductase